MVDGRDWNERSKGAGIAGRLRRLDLAHSRLRAGIRKLDNICGAKEADNSGSLRGCGGGRIRLSCRSRRSGGGSNYGRLAGGCLLHLLQDLKQTRIALGGREQLLQRDGLGTHIQMIARYFSSLAVSASCPTAMGTPQDVEFCFLQSTACSTGDVPVSGSAGLTT